MDQEKENFIGYLALTKGLMDRSIEQYLYYYKKLDQAKISDQEYVNQFIQSWNNNPIVRGMMLNLLEFRKLNKIIDMPPKKSGSPKKRIIRDISDEEINALRDYLYDKSFKRGLIFDLIYQGALRRVEIPTIRINSFRWKEFIENFKKGIKKPCHLIILGKRDKERTVLINFETALNIFLYYEAKYQFKNDDEINAFANSPSLVFGKISEWYVWDVVHQGSRRCLGRDIRTHELRHARATELERMGVPIKDIKIYLGHSNLATTEIYLHTSEKESIANISEIINQKG
jgi:integrase